MVDQTGSGDDESIVPPQPFKKTGPQISAEEFESMELKSLEKLCDRFRTRRNDRVSVHSTMVDLETKDEDLARRIFKRLKGMGAIEERDDYKGDPHSVISPSIIEIAADRKREMQARREPADRVASAERWVRSHPAVSKLLIALVVLTFIIALLNQLAELIGRFRN